MNLPIENMTKEDNMTDKQTTEKKTIVEIIDIFIKERKQDKLDIINIIDTLKQQIDLLKDEIDILRLENKNIRLIKHINNHKEDIINQMAHHKEDSQDKQQG